MYMFNFNLNYILLFHNEISLDETPYNNIDYQLNLSQSTQDCKRYRQ